LVSVKKGLISLGETENLIDWLLRSRLLTADWLKSNFAIGIGGGFLPFL
jgi:hypothetical protein